MTFTDENYAKRLLLHKQSERLAVHSFHRYFGKLIPGIPAFAISEFTKPGDTVLDPFSGSGTTLVEARELGRKGIGVDINPLACFISKVKTTHINQEHLASLLEPLIQDLGAPSELVADDDPYVVNMDHWFRAEVKQQLLMLRKRINAIANQNDRDFFLGVFSAFIRTVSNADPQHVFPGYSKRMRRLDEEGRLIDVAKSFQRAANRRIKQVATLTESAPETRIFNGQLKELKLRKSSVDLVVTNPPYISSIRYLETMKIEMGWLDFIKSQRHYLDMDRTVIGTERFYKDDLGNISATGITRLDDQISALKDKNPKMAKVVHDYFVNMREVFTELSRVIKPGGTLVIKISESKVRSELIPTHLYFLDICKKSGFTLVSDIVDDYDSSSRSLLTARNSYSGLMTQDHILILRRD